MRDGPSTRSHRQPLPGPGGSGRCWFPSALKELEPRTRGRACPGISAGHTAPLSRKKPWMEFFSGHHARAEYPWVPGGAGRSPTLLGELGQGATAERCLLLSFPSPGMPAGCKGMVGGPNPSPPRWRVPARSDPSQPPLTRTDAAPGWPRQRGSPETLSEGRLS